MNLESSIIAPLDVELTAPKQLELMANGEQLSRSNEWNRSIDAMSDQTRESKEENALYRRKPVKTEKGLNQSPIKIVDRSGPTFEHPELVSSHHRKLERAAQ